MKKLISLLLLAVLLCSAALAEITVEIDRVDGEECYVAIKADHLTFTLNKETWLYETADGLVWQAYAIPFPTLEPLLMPQNAAEVRRVNTLYAALQDASGFWEQEVYGIGKAAVYSAPDKQSLRGADNKAAVELSKGVRLLMTLEDWSLVEYQISRDAYRIGWVKNKGLGSAPVMLTDVEVALTEDAVLTDDPVSSWRRVAAANELHDVHLLAQRDAFWGYVSAKLPDDQPVWGFVPLRCMIREDVQDQEMMSRLAGEWVFSGGGELMGEVFTLSADGRITFWQLSEEELMTGTHLTEGLKEHVAAEKARWRIVDGTNGYERDFLLTHEDGRQERFHLYDHADGVLTLTQCEAGGSWQLLHK